MRRWIALVVILGFSCAPLSRWTDEFANVEHLVVYELIWWAFIAAVLGYVRGVEHRPLASIGLRSPGLRGAALSVATGVATVVVLAIIYLAVFPAFGVDETAQTDRLIATPLWWRVISVVRAGVGEEIVFRGYAIERVHELTRSRAAAAIIPCAVFALAHVGPWGWSHLVIAGTGGAVFTALYLWRRNLWVNIIAHVVVDGVAVLSS
jgi:membrane protease YdiL (CAAX protease family)